MQYNAALVLIISSLLQLQAVTVDCKAPFLSSSHRSRRRIPMVTSLSSSVNILLSLRGGDIKTITALSQVENIINNQASGSNQLVVLDFAANNCPPCEMIAPIYSDLSDLDEFDNKVLFLKVNVNDCPDVAERYGVDGWPTFLLFKDGNVVDSVVGGQAAKESLYSLVAKYT